MRLFVALKPPPAALAELGEVAAPLRDRWPELRWEDPDRWHVTLAFLGEVDDGKLDELSRRLGRAAARHVGQSLAIGPGDAFSSVKRGRVLITRIVGQTSAVAGLAASVAAGARRAGAPPPDESKKFSPHLTLARSREPTDLSDPVAALDRFTGQPWIPTEIHLIRSLLHPRVRHEPVGRWPLRAT